MKKRKTGISKITAIIAIMIFSTAIVGAVYGHWEKRLTLGATVDTGTWYTPPELEFSKEIDGVFLHGETPTEPPETDPHKVDDYYNTLEPTNPDYSPWYPLIYINHQAPGIRQWFKITLTLDNTGKAPIDEIVVRDYIHTKLAIEFIIDDEFYTSYNPSYWVTPTGYVDDPVGWDVPPDPDDPITTDENVKLYAMSGNALKVKWTVTSLEAGQTESLTIWIATKLKGGKLLKYTPTSNEGDDLPINVEPGREYGASVEVKIEGSALTYIPVSEFWTAWIPEEMGNPDSIISRLVLGDGTQQTLPWKITVQADIPGPT